MAVPGLTEATAISREGDFRRNIWAFSTDPLGRPKKGQTASIRHGTFGADFTRRSSCSRSLFMEVTRSVLNGDTICRAARDFYGVWITKYRNGSSMFLYMCGAFGGMITTSPLLT